MPTIISTLKDETKTNTIAPRTCLKALFDDQGNYLDNTLTASDVNALKNGKISSIDSAINAISDWVDGTSNVTWTETPFQNSKHARLRKKNGVVYLEVEFYPVSMTANTNKTLCTLPTGFKPSERVIFNPLVVTTGTTTTPAAYGFVNIYNNGDVDAAVNASGNYFLALNLSFTL